MQRLTGEDHKDVFIIDDTQFVNPHQIVAIKDMNLDTIAMVKKRSSESTASAGRIVLCDADGTGGYYLPPAHDDSCGSDVPDGEDFIPGHRRTTRGVRRRFLQQTAGIYAASTQLHSVRWA